MPVGSARAPFAHRGTPPASESLEGHFGRIEYRLENGPGHPGVAVESLVDTSSAALLDEVNYTVGFIEASIDGFTTDGSWSDAGPNWGGHRARRFGLWPSSCAHMTTTHKSPAS